MTDWTLTKIRIMDGIWHGDLQGSPDATPDLQVTHLNAMVPRRKIESSGPGSFVFSVPIPADLLADGVQTFLISDNTTETGLTSFTNLYGDALAEDIRAEMDMLRAELDLLRRAFRSHCVETLEPGHT